MPSTFDIFIKYTFHSELCFEMRTPEKCFTSRGTQHNHASRFQTLRTLWTNYILAADQLLSCISIYSPLTKTASEGRVFEPSVWFACSCDFTVIKWAWCNLTCHENSKSDFVAYCVTHVPDWRTSLDCSGTCARRANIRSLHKHKFGLGKPVTRTGWTSEKTTVAQ